MNCIAVGLYISQLRCMAEDLASDIACRHDTQQACEWQQWALLL